MNHIDKEKSVLFNVGYRVTSDDEPTMLWDRLCQVGWRAFGGKTREELVQIADELEQPWST